MERRSSLARDVAVNVVANLIAAGIVYLLAVAGGYLRANGRLMLLAAGTVAAFGVGLLLWRVGEWARRRRVGWLVSAAANGLAVLVVAYFVYMSAVSLLDW